MQDCVSTFQGSLSRRSKFSMYWSSTSSPSELLQILSTLQLAAPLKSTSISQSTKFWAPECPWETLTPKTRSSVPVSQATTCPPPELPPRAPPLNAEELLALGGQWPPSLRPWFLSKARPCEPLDFLGQRGGNLSFFVLLLCEPVCGLSLSPCIPLPFCDCESPYMQEFGTVPCRKRE